MTISERVLFGISTFNYYILTNAFLWKTGLYEEREIDAIDIKNHDNVFCLKTTVN